MSEHRIKRFRFRWPYDGLLTLISISVALLVVVMVGLSWAVLTPEPRRRAPLPEGDYYGHWLCFEVDPYGKCYTTPLKQYKPTYPRTTATS